VLKLPSVPLTVVVALTLVALVIDPVPLVLKLLLTLNVPVSVVLPRMLTVVAPMVDPTDSNVVTPPGVFISSVFVDVLTSIVSKLSMYSPLTFICPLASV
jgi:hypothetical protein